ncbi:MAG TPA: NAD(P)-dependent oxidoreductase [Solirubrobacteraceae bacterium]|nr:NAD(P)-dependent oxidoreductase [Solirubrobacteraceae bacterium]
MKRVLLTGASGFVGAQAIAPLVQRGFEVHAVSSRERPAANGPGGSGGPARAADCGPELSVAADRDGVRDGVRWHRADLLMQDAATALVERVQPTHLLHFAWYAEHGRFWTSTENLRWVEASLRLLRAFGEAGGERAVMAGTCAEYDWSASGGYVESSMLAPRTLYGASKQALESVAQAWCEQVGISFAWGRIFFLHGPGEHPERLVPAVARAVLSGEPALCSHGRQLRDFLHSADVAGAFVALLDSSVAGPVNVGSGEPVSVAEVVRLVAAAAGDPQLVRLGALPAREGEPEELVGDVTRLHEQVGWAPRLTLAQGIERSVAWWRERREPGAG